MDTNTHIIGIKHRNIFVLFHLALVINYKIQLNSIYNSQFTHIPRYLFIE